MMVQHQCICGNPMSPEAKVCIICSKKDIGKKRVKRKCRICNTEFMTMHPNSIYCNSECRKKGKNKHNQWIAQKRIMDQDNGVCYICGNKGDIALHHIIQQIDEGTEIVPLCRTHHILIHKFMWLLNNKGYKIIKVPPPLQ